MGKPDTLENMKKFEETKTKQTKYNIVFVTIGVTVRYPEFVLSDVKVINDGNRQELNSGWRVHGDSCGQFHIKVSRCTGYLK